jgi:hypothetical protein
MFHRKNLGRTLATGAGVSHRANPLEILIGRSLAFCAHPYAAWRVGSAAVRGGLLVAYFTAGYVTALCALELFVVPSLQP